MGGSDCGDSRDICRTVRRGVLDGGVKGEMKTVEAYRFDELYLLIKDVVSMYSDSGEREAAIAGYMRCMDPDEVLTIEQINMILALRYPEKEESTCIGWGATGA